MKINIKTTVAALVLALVLPLHAQAQGAGRAAKPKKKIKWTSMAPKLGDDFFATPEAARIGDNLLFYQHPSGGWPKNLQLHDELTDDMRKRIEKMKLKKRYATHRDYIPGEAVQRHRAEEIPRRRGARFRLYVRGPVRQRRLAPVLPAL